MFRLFSDAAQANNTIMLISVDIKSFLAEAATAASAWPCRQNRRPGYALALAGRYAR